MKTKKPTASAFSLQPSSFLQRPPYDHPVAYLVPHINLARLGRQLARKRDLQAQIRAIDIQIRQQLSALSAEN